MPTEIQIACLKHGLPRYIDGQTADHEIGS